MQPQSIVWDPVKAALNLAKHAVDFEDAATVLSDPLLLIQSNLGHSEDEQRWLALGESKRELLLVVVHNEDEQTIRMISARKAGPRERRRYEQQS